ncbi:MAG: hypothetical protein J2P52_09615 [Blastocatellia bacterium]|nr:hypothetical protein [Blastocatellia bacterium]
MDALEFYNQRFADGGRRVFVGALNNARRRGQYKLSAGKDLTVIFTYDETAQRR